MLDLDFAFFNMRDNNRQGLANRKSFLDRLAPLLFPPRVEKLIDINRLGVKGCNVRLPLGEGNWNVLNQDNRGLMIDKTAAILDEFEIDSLGVDRRLKPIFETQPHSLPVRFGDHFISALAAVLTEKAIQTHDIKKLVVVGQVPQLPSFLNYLGRYHLPISMQNYNPGRYEILAYRLLYEEGLAVSNSCLNPRLWGKGDLIISVDAKSLAMASREAFYIRLDDERYGLAPDLEQALQLAGLAPALYILAPILESCLLSEAGNIHHNGESYTLNDGTADIGPPERLIEAGASLGIWEPFLDKAECSIYN